MVPQQADAEGEQQGKLEVGAGLEEPAAVRVLAPARPDQGAEGEPRAQQGQIDEQKQRRGGPIGPQQEREQAGLLQRGPQQLAGDGPDPRGARWLVPRAPPHPAHGSGAGERGRIRREARDDVTDPEPEQERQQRQRERTGNLGLSAT